MFTTLSLVLFGERPHKRCIHTITMKTPALILAAILILPSLASAQTFVLDTGTPTSTNGPLEVNSGQSLAAEFSASAGTDIDLLSVYLTPSPSASTGSFVLNIYSGATGLPSNSNRSARDIFTTTATYTAAGWNTAAVNWTLPTTGDYWVTISSSAGDGFDAPLETGLGTGTAPALSFAFSGSNGFFTVSNTATSAFGIQIAAAPEPSSWALALVCAGLFVGLRRRFARA
jgi:hypothetical protein